MTAARFALECFDRQDDRFVAAVRDLHDPVQLAELADRWKRDTRPWAREQGLAYLRLPLDCFGHEPLVKRMFKQAEAEGDDEWLAAFLVAFDRLIRRVRRTRWRYDPQTRSSWQEEVVQTPRDALRQARTRSARDPRTGRSVTVTVQATPAGRLFSYRTRYHLRRRAWRYFRRLGFQRPADYVAAICRALADYEDDDLNRGEHLLECWGLMHACFAEHPALEFAATRISVKPGGALSELSPAPAFSSLWADASAAPRLLSLLSAARSGLVRGWAIQLLRRAHAARLREFDVSLLVPLLLHSSADVRQFAAEAFNESERLKTISLEEWLSLLKANDPLVLALVCDAMRRHVSGDGLSLEQAVTLACAKAAPVARLGLDLVRERPATSVDERAALADLAEAQCPALAAEITTFALRAFSQPETYDRDAVTRFFDGALAEMRAAAWSWLAPESPGYGDAALWSRLCETPYDDVKLRLIEALDRRAAVSSPAASLSKRSDEAPPCDEELAGLWCSVLLGVHRGGRQKQRAIAQLGRALEQSPQQAESLLPVLAVALRSLRAPERRAALAAFVTALERRPELEAKAARFLPELNLAPQT